MNGPWTSPTVRLQSFLCSIRRPASKHAHFAHRKSVIIFIALCLQSINLFLTIRIDFSKDSISLLCHLGEVRLDPFNEIVSVLLVENGYCNLDLLRPGIRLFNISLEDEICTELEGLYGTRFQPSRSVREASIPTLGSSSSLSLSSAP